MNHKKWAFLFPGQGAQYPGMAKDFYDQFPVARQVFDEADTYLKSSFSKLIFEGPSAELTLTKKAQVAIYVVSIALQRTIESLFPHLKPTVCAGLSLGEYTALTAAHKISFKDCLDLVVARASYMHEACERERGTMQVNLGMEASVVEEVIQGLNPPHQIWVANLNCPGQVVIAGSVEGMAVGIEALKQKGAKRAIPLDVSGAFHSGLMLSAQESLSPKIQSVPLSVSPIDFVMNVPGDYINDLQKIRENLIHQVTSPVRWEKGVRAMMEKGIDVYLEIGPGKTLAGMNKRIGVTQPTLSIEKVSDLDELHRMIDHAAIER